MVKPRSPATAPPDPPLTEEQVLAYLRGHPGFLQQYGDEIARLAAPARFADQSSVVDLQKFMIDRLQRHSEQMRKVAEDLAIAARRQSGLVQRVHEAALTLLNARSDSALGQAIQEDLPALLDVDVVMLAFEPDGVLRPVPGFSLLRSGQVDETLGLADLVLRPQGGGDPGIFGPAAGLVRAAALVRLSPPLGASGLLAIGSRDDLGRFSGQGSELLSFLGRAVECSITRWWAPDAG